MIQLAEEVLPVVSSLTSIAEISSVEEDWKPEDEWSMSMVRYWSIV
jgi:hypothetical protein